MVHCENGNFGEIQKLLTNWSKKRVKSELSKTNNIGNTCLSLAVKNNYYYIVKYLVSHGANINHINNAKQPILFIPCWSNDIEMVQILFESGADVNHQDSRGWTPLMIAGTQGYEDMVQFLLDKHADVDIKDKYGKKAADKAKSHSIFYMLSSAGIDKRLQNSKDQDSDYSPNIPENTMSDPNMMKNYESESNVVRNLFSSTMPAPLDKSPSRSNYKTSTPNRSNRSLRNKSTSKPREKDAQIGSKSPYSTKSSTKNMSTKRKNEVLKVIYSCIKRNETRMNLSQRSVFTNLINDELLDATNSLYDKLNRAIHTYNQKLQAELVNHINLKLKIVCIERGVFQQHDFDKNLVNLNQNNDCLPYRDLM